MAGFIKIHRKLLEWGWFSSPTVLSTFLFLLLTANYSEGYYKGVLIKRGQAVFGYQSIANKTGISIQQARSAIEKLKKTGEITVWTNRQFSVATIEKWELYQSDDQQTDNKRITNDQQTDNRRLTDDQQTDNIIQEIKKERKEEYIASKPINFDAIVGLFNAICVSLPKVAKLTDARKAAIRGAVHRGVDLESLFKAVEASDFLTGRSGNFHGCGFDWIMKPSNQVKIIEGNYRNKTAQITDEVGDWWKDGVRVG